MKPEARLEQLGGKEVWEKVWKPYDLPKLSRKGGLAGVTRQISDHISAVDKRTEEEATILLGLVETRSNTVEDNKRWTFWVSHSIEAYSHARTYLSTYLTWLREEDPTLLERPE